MPDPPSQQRMLALRSVRGLNAGLRRLPRLLLPRTAQVYVGRAREIWLVFLFTVRRWLRV